MLCRDVRTHRRISNHATIDNWEDVLTNDLYDIEESVKDFLQSLSVRNHANAMSLTNQQTHEQSSSYSDIIEFGKHNAKATATALAEQKDWYYKLFHVVFYLTVR